MEKIFLHIIAELANHGGSIDRAKKTIKKAKESGASAIKIQTYTPDTMTINVKDDFKIKKAFGKAIIYMIYIKAYTPYEWHKELFNMQMKLELLFSTP